ncbi:(Fe-S)-binding protein [bacterium]|nr:(Fe-S)-binding protein [bacterium]
MALLDHQKLNEALKSCVKCGKCLTKCPIYRENRDEKGGARGKIALLRHVCEKDQTLINRLDHVADQCLYCLNCQSVCPQNVELGLLIPFLRQMKGERTRSRKWTRSVLSKKLSDPEFIRRLPDHLRRFQLLLTASVPENRGIHLRFPLPSVPRSRVLPNIALRSFVQSHPHKYPGEPGRPRVGFFVGCLHNFLEVGTAVATIKLLQRLGMSVIVPEQQTCCGLPHFSSGMIEAAEKLARSNIEVFADQGCDYIISGCPTCVAMLSLHYPRLGPRHNPFTGRTMDTLSFLALHAPDLVKRKASVSDHDWYTYHDPCHLAGELNVRSQPRELLKMFLGDQFREMEAADTCCGGGGSFAVTQYQMSLQIGSRKREHIVQWREGILAECAERASVIPQSFTVVTACPGCEIQLNDLLYRQTPEIRVRHVVDLLAESVLD